nr:GT1 domain-containing protein isoform X1 [Misgurnus anguillicaudatus]
MMAKQRAVYFSAAELQLLMDGYEEVRDLIKTKGNTIAAAKVRQDAWRKIAAKLNASNMGPKRTWQQVKVKYKNVIQGANKRKAAMKRTGGDPLPTKEEYIAEEENDLDAPIIESIVGGCCSDPGDVASCSSYVKVTEHGLTLLQPPTLSEEEQEEPEPVDDVKVLYKKYLQAEISNRRQEMAYRALKMRKVQKEIELLDRKLAVSVTFCY